MTAYDDLIGKKKEVKPVEEPYVDFEGSFLCGMPGCSLDTDNAKYYLSSGRLVWICPEGHINSNKESL